MKKKILIVLIVLIVALASIVFYYLKQTPIINPNTVENNNSMNQNSVGDDNQEMSQNKLVTDEFEINLPEGWIQSTPIMGASAMAVNEKEQISDPAVQAINFRSYLAVSYEVLQGKTVSEYLQAVKSGLIELVTDIVFTKEQDLMVNGRAAHAIEAEMTQNGVDFSVLIVVIEGEKDDVWAVSFNTTKSNWAGYKDAFYGVANSFNLKK